MYDQVSRIIVSGAYPYIVCGRNLKFDVCGFILEVRSGAYHFVVTFALTLTSNLIFTFFCVGSISPILQITFLKVVLC